MKKNFSKPVIEIVEIEKVDVIADSTPIGWLKDPTQNPPVGGVTTNPLVQSHNNANR